MQGWVSRLVAGLWLVAACAGLRAEKVADLPEPTSYVNDFAHVISVVDAQTIEDLNRALFAQANARVVVVTINTLDDGQSVEEFTVALEEKWKLGKTGEDRSAILLFVKSPPKRRIETGYGLEGILNDAKVGAMLDQGNDAERAGNFSQAMVIEDQGLADVIAKDANVTLTPVVHTYHRQNAAPPQKIGAGQIVIGILLVLLFLFLLKTGNLGWAFLLLNMFTGGGGGGGSDDDEGGSFGGGGGSGGGGASRDF